MAQLQVWCLKFPFHEGLLSVAPHNFYRPMLLTKFNPILQYFLSNLLISPQSSLLVL